VIDLHLHSTASDGVCAPAELVSRVHAAGITTMALTDHDTGAHIPDVQRLAGDAGIAFIPGIEITAVWQGSDIHMLAYFIDPASPRMTAFLEQQRVDRERRARLIGERLAGLGAPVDIEQAIVAAHPTTISRPVIARALVAAGHAPGARVAFDTYLAEGGQAYVPRLGATPGDVVDLVNADGGVVSMAHPGVTGHDEIIPGLAAHGLAAIEVFHTDHGPATTARYLAMARNLGLAVTGGSDFHGTYDRERELGRSILPAEHFAEFCRRARRSLPVPSPGAPLWPAD
jgi:predicted metal-dependent phosphoesterase TrpH